MRHGETMRYLPTTSAQRREMLQTIGVGDLETLVEGLKIVRRIAEAPALRPYRGREVWPGEAARTDEDLAAHVRARSETLYHPTGTCRMGNDPLAVVDSKADAPSGLPPSFPFPGPCSPREHGNSPETPPASGASTRSPTAPTCRPRSSPPRSRPPRSR